MIKKNILILDDDPDFANSLKEKLIKTRAINRIFDINSSKGILKKSIYLLEERRRSARDNLKTGTFDDTEEIDNADILIIDYDLIEVDSSITGEYLSYLCRCYSQCGLIIALNQYYLYDETFDLSLNQHPESYADLNIPSKSISNPGLWIDKWDEFRPWSWPMLPSAMEKFERRAKALINNLDTPIFNYLKLSEFENVVLSRRAIEFISKSGLKEIDEITFRDFINPRISGNGLLGKDKSYSEEAAARLVGARIGKWLDGIVLPEQDVLVDAPNLISRYPSLVNKTSNKIKDWNKVASFVDHDQLGLSDVIDPFMFKYEDWISRPVWFWSEIRKHDGIQEVVDPWSLKKPDWVFCEDVSRFLPIGKTRKFMADLESPHKRRYVKHLDGIKYMPNVRFSL